MRSGSITFSTTFPLSRLTYDHAALRIRGRGRQKQQLGPRLAGDLCHVADKGGVEAPAGNQARRQRATIELVMNSRRSMDSMYTSSRRPVPRDP